MTRRSRAWLDTHAEMLERLARAREAEGEDDFRAGRKDNPYASRHSRAGLAWQKGFDRARMASEAAGPRQTEADKRDRKADESKQFFLTGSRG